MERVIVIIGCCVNVLIIFLLYQFCQQQRAVERRTHSVSRNHQTVITIDNSSEASRYAYEVDLDNDTNAPPYGPQKMDVSALPTYHEISNGNIKKASECPPDYVDIFKPAGP